MNTLTLNQLNIFIQSSFYPFFFHAAATSCRGAHGAVGARRCTKCVWPGAMGWTSGSWPHLPTSSGGRWRRWGTKYCYYIYL